MAIPVQNDIVRVVADGAGVLSLFTGPQWGLFTEDGQPAFQSGGIVGNLGLAAARLIGLGSPNVGEVEFRQDHRISTAPQEEGAFLSYNKVSTPYQARVGYIVGGLATQRQQFLRAVQTLQSSLTLLTLVMPDFTFQSCNVVHHDFRRTAKNGVSMFVVEVWVEEVRVTGTTAYTATKTPAGANQANGGTVQPTQPSAGATSAAAALN